MKVMGILSVPMVVVDSRRVRWTLDIVLASRVSWMGGDDRDGIVRSTDVSSLSLVK